MATPVSPESLSHLVGIDYASKRVFEEIRDDVLDAIKGFGDRYDIRQQGRSTENAIFVLSPDSTAIYKQLVHHFAKRPAFSVKIEPSPLTVGGGGGEETVVIYRQAGLPLTKRQTLKKYAHLILGVIVSASYLYYIGTAPSV